MLAYQIAPCAVVVDGVVIPLVEDTRSCIVGNKDVRVVFKDVSRRALVWDRKLDKQVTKVYPAHQYVVTLHNYTGQKVIVQQPPHVTINVAGVTDEGRVVTPQLLYS
jgi:hypothetical protein